MESIDDLSAENILRRLLIGGEDVVPFKADLSGSDGVRCNIRKNLYFKLVARFCPQEEVAEKDRKIEILEREKRDLTDELKKTQLVIANACANNMERRI